MAKLIVKSPYIKSGGKANGYMKYIATRDGVEILPVADGYMRYMATRPGTEKRGLHGLFGNADNVDLNAAMAELETVQGNIWTHIISLRREDAARLGYDNADAWRNLLKTHCNDIAEAMKISPQNFRWYAAFHNEGDHPHVHMMAWSARQNDGYLTQIGIEKIKSNLTNTVFEHELLHIYQEKTVSRDRLIRETRENLRELRKRGVAEPIAPEICDLMLQLSTKLSTISGKKQYGYMPKDVKKLVDKIVDELATQPCIRESYNAWWECKMRLQNYYETATPKQPPLSQQKEFRSIKNAILREAEALNSVDLEQQFSATSTHKKAQTPPIILSTARLIANLVQMFESNIEQQAEQHHSHVESKLRRKLREKKQALGQTENDHEMHY